MNQHAGRRNGATGGKHGLVIPVGGIHKDMVVAIQKIKIHAVGMFLEKGLVQCKC